MATVNLGSIKFNWQGAYAGGTAYAVDDVVSYNGSSYVCTAASTGNLPTDTNFWDQMSSAGTNGTDLTSTLTTQGDILYRDGSGLQRLGAGTSGQALITNGTGANPSWGDTGGGITQADMFRITADFNFSTTETFITANWERVDTNFDKIGTGMTESSGVFTFPETGIYLIQVGATVGNGGAGGGRYGEISTHFTENNSTYEKRAYSQDNQTFADGETNHFHQCFFDVLDVSTHKVKFATLKQSTSYNYSMRVDTNANINSFSFIRLGDT
jgi:hypothetical protein